MIKSPKTIRIFISSPGDVAEERTLCRKVIERLEGEFSGQAILEPIFWEHEPLLATQSFQEQIIPPSETDIVATILWSRLGTRLPAQFTRPDGSRYESGTEFEFEDAIQSYRKRGTPEILIYRKMADPQVSLTDKEILMDKLRQKEALDKFFDRWFHDKTEGTLIAAFHPFGNSADFEDIFETHLRKLIKTKLPDTLRTKNIQVIHPIWQKGSPFRGLDVFMYEHSPVFFGRTKAVSEIIESLRIQSASGKAFVMVLGMSGGGKSSLARAGVIPMLTQPGVIEGVGLWRRAIMKPSESEFDLFDGLAASLLHEDALPELNTDITNIKELSKILHETPAAIIPLVKAGLSQAASTYATDKKLTKHPSAKLVLLVDQMEEIFNLSFITHEIRHKFIAALDALASSGRVWIITTLRSDYYPRTLELPNLVALKEGKGQYDLLTPTSGELGQMIRQPAQAAGLQFEVDDTTNESLDDVLRDDASRDPGTLPLLEFTLEELYKNRTENNVLTFDAYKKLGGVEGALAQRAEEVFQSLKPEEQKIFDPVMHNLVCISSDDAERISRKYAPMDTIIASPESKLFVEAFVKARLFTTDLTTEGKSVVNIAHEALLRNWPRLQEWIEKNKELLRIHTRLNSASIRWEEENRSGDFLYSGGKLVSETEELVKNKNIELSGSEQAFINASISKRKRIWWAKRLVAAVILVFAIVASAAAYIARQERDHAKTEARKAAQVSEFLVGIFKVSDPSETLGETITAREILDKGARKIENDLADQPEVQATLMNTMGMVYKELGLYDQAVTLQKKALNIRRQLFDHNNPDVASSINDLGEVYLVKGDYTEAENLIREALAIRRKIFGEEHPDVAQSLSNLGDVQECIGNDSLSEVLHSEGLAIRRKIYGNEHVSVSNSLIDLGFLAYKSGKYSKAVDLYLESLAICQNLYGEIHPTIADAYNNLASVYNLQGNYDKAAEYNMEALEIYRKIYGEEHPEVAGSLNNLGFTYSNKGDSLKAVELYEQALQLRRKIYGNEHREVANSLSNLASMYYKQGKYQEAEEMFMEAIAILRKVHGNLHINVAISINNLANVYKELGDYSKAEDLVREALEILKELYGTEHPYVALFQNSLAYFQCQKGNYHEAEELYKEALTTQQKMLPEGHWRTAVTLCDYGNCCVNLRQFEEAEIMLLQSYDMLTANFGEEDSRSKKSLSFIIHLYEEWDKPDKASYYKELL